MTDLREDEKAAIKAAKKYLKRALSQCSKSLRDNEYNRDLKMDTAVRLIDLARVQLKYAWMQHSKPGWPQMIIKK